jgi:subfamily B ATP-binding cassette protein MsbA
MNPMQNSSSLFQRIYHMLQPFWRMALLGVVCNILYASIDAGFTWMMRPFFDKTFLKLDVHFLYQIPWIVLTGIGLRGLMSGFGGYCMTYVARSMINTLRQQVFRKFNHLPAKFLDVTPSGQLLSKLLYDVEQVSQVSADAITDIVQNSCLIIGLLGVMLFTSWQLTAVFMFAIPGIALLVNYTNKRIRRISRQVQNSMGDVTAIASEVIDGYKEIRMFSAQNFVESKFNHAALSSRRNDLKVAMSKAVNVFGVQMILALASCVIIIVAIWLAKRIHITPGTFITISVAMLQLIKPMKTLTTINATIQRGLTGAESVFNLLDEKEEVDNPVTCYHSPSKGEIEFRQVSFAYESHTPILENFNLKIKAGETIALVGASGSGKTTLINLLPRFYEIQKGEILLDGQCIKDFSLDDLRTQFSWVGQHVLLFNDSIANNIAYGQKEIEHQRLWQAIEQANASEFIQQLPQGIDTLIGENGFSLSGGQRQRLALARAIYKNAPIFILDEATAALDNQTEQMIQQALEQFHHQRTLIIIAHRLSTIQFADKIFVMQAGKIIEAGHHQELLAQQGHYASLYHAQLQPNLKHHAETNILV